MKWIALALLALTGIYGTYTFSRPTVQTDVAKLLHSETLRQIVTNRFATQVVIEEDSGDILFGTDYLFAVGTVYFQVGIDLEKMEVIRGAGNTPSVTITLPDAEVLSQSLDQSSVRIMRKASVLQRLSDIGSADEGNLIRVKLLEAADVFVKEQQLLPSRPEMEGRISAILEDLGLNTETLVFAVPAS